MLRARTATAAEELDVLINENIATIVAVIDETLSIIVENGRVNADE